MSDDLSNKLPQRPKEHVLGGRAVDVFRYRKKPDWVPVETPTDYGWDVLVTIAESERVKDDFFVQLKGHEKPNYIEQDKFISEQLKVSTVRWLLRKPEPTMICVCDLGKKSKEPVYFVWLQDAMEDIKKTNPNWEEQEYINLRIPIKNIFDDSAHKQIEEHVKNYHVILRISKAIGETILPATGQFSTETLKPYQDKPSEFIIEKVAPLLEEFGLVDVTTTDTDTEIAALSPEERELFVKLNKVSTFLNAFNDTEASKMLIALDKESENAPDGLKARYFNCRGVLSLHLRNDEDALTWLKKAYELRPRDPKFVTNYSMALLARYHFAEDKKTALIPEDFLDKLDEIVRDKPNFWPAKRVKAYWLSDTSTPEAAQDFLRSSSALEKDPVEARICLAEIYKEHGRVDDALEILRQINDDRNDLGHSYFSLYAFLLFAKATGNLTAQSKVVLYGAGPKALSLSLLKDAINYYDKAYKLLSAKGFPKAFEETVVNYSSALDLLGNHEKSEVINKAYLEHYPDSIRANAALASSLFKQHKYPQATKYARVAFEGEPTSSTAFTNLLLSLFLSEEYEEVLRLVSDRIVTGFKDKREEGIARTMAVFSYRELGLEKEAEEQIKVLEQDKELNTDAIIVRASIANEYEQKMAIYQKGLAELPNNERLLDQYLGVLIPVKEKTAQEVVNVIDKIEEYRQLLPEEYYNLGHAYLLLNIPEKAEKVFRAGVNRYPTVQRFLFDHAVTLFILGYEDESYNELKRYLEEGKRDYSVLKNLAIVARNTGRTGEAIRLLSATLKKTSNESEKGEIHCQLYELKRRGEFTPKELRHHIVEFGKTTNKIPELEARYLMLFLLAPEIPDEEKDAEVTVWISEFRERLHVFTQTYPNFKGFRAFSIPEAATGEQIRQEIMSTIAYMALPHDLATASIKIATRSGEWPTVFRAHYLYSKSIFDYWELCVKSKESQHAIHIWRPTNNIIDEVAVAKDARFVCVDITALLTLAEFDLFDVLKIFEQIIMPWEARKTIEREMHGFKPPHSMARKIYEWMISHKQKIRTRSIPDEDEDKYKQTAAGVLLETERSIKAIFKDGIGESLLLAQQLGIPLYSDESYIRSIAKSTYGAKAFSTSSLLRSLQERKYVELREETRILSQMIGRNYTIITFTPFHLHSRLKDLLIQAKAAGGVYLKSEDITKDEVLMPFLNQFADSALHEMLVPVALGWWLIIAGDPDMPNEQLTECLYYISYSISMKSIGAVLVKMHKEEQEKRLTGMLALFLWQAYKKNKKLIGKAWPAIKSCCTRYFPGKEEKLIFDFLLKHLGNYMEKDADLDNGQKATALFEIPEYLPFEDKAKFINYFIKSKPTFSH